MCVCVCVCVYVWVGGCVGVCVGVWVGGNMGGGCVGVWVCGSVGVWVCGFVSVGVWMLSIACCFHTRRGQLYIHQGNLHGQDYVVVTKTTKSSFGMRLHLLAYILEVRVLIVKICYQNCGT